MAVRVVAGLGNPGPRYEGTRHNVGRAVVDRLAARLGARWRRRGLAEVAEARVVGLFVVLVKPLTYMNASGEAVAAVARRYRVAPQEVLLVYDDLDLPVGRLRLRRGGSAGGHRGVLSVLAALGTQEVGRLRVGIGRPPAGVDPADYVLAPFGEEEVSLVAEAVERAADAVVTVLHEGYEAAMNRYNG